MARTWTIQLEQIAVAKPDAPSDVLLTTGDNMTLTGLFLLPPSNEYLIAVFVERGASEAELATEAERQQLYADIQAAAEFFDVPPAALTQDMLAQYKTQTQVLPANVTVMQQDALVEDYEERLAALEGFLTEEAEDAVDED